MKLIQKQYHSNCMTYPPDCPGGNSENAKQIKESYTTQWLESSLRRTIISIMMTMMRSYTIKIENHVSHFWDQVLSNRYGDPPLTDKTMAGIGGMSTLLMVIQTVTSPWASGTALGDTISQKFWFRVVVEGTSWLSALLSEVSSMAKSVPQLQEEAPIVEYSCKSGY